MFKKSRPLNDDEKQLKLPVVISCNEGKGEVSVVQNTAYKQIDKTFSFDKVRFFIVFLELENLSCVD